MLSFSNLSVYYHNFAPYGAEVFFIKLNLTMAFEHHRCGIMVIKIKHIESESSVGAALSSILFHFKKIISHPRCFSISPVVLLSYHNIAPNGAEDFFIKLNITMAFEHHRCDIVVIIKAIN